MIGLGSVLYAEYFFILKQSLMKCSFKKEQEDTELKKQHLFEHVDIHDIPLY